MKVFVVTKAKPLQSEIYIGVKKTLKDAEKLLRSEFPHMRKTEDSISNQHNYASDKDSLWLLFVHEEEI